MTVPDTRRLEWLDGMYVRFVIAFFLFVFVAFVTALMLLDHVRVLTGNWTEEASSVAGLALVTIGSIVTAGACGIGAFISRALTVDART